jgi:hypothetical protein
MDKKELKGGGIQETEPRRFGKLIFAGLMLITLMWLFTPFPSPQLPSGTATLQITPASVLKPPTSAGIHSAQLKAEPVEASSPVPAYPVLKPEPMKLDKKVLVSAEWNSSADAFGLDKPAAEQEGATVGPSSVAYSEGHIYVLDNVNKRVLKYDPNGSLVSSIALPTKGATDVMTDDQGAVMVVDHHNDRIYRIEGDIAKLMGSVTTRDDFPIGTKFHYDTASNTLMPRDVDGDGLAKVDGNNLVVALADGKELALGFESPVACVEEVVTDGQGIVWVLYTLEGDYRMRRLARVDPVGGTARVAELDVWFAFDATRHMAPAQNGVVLFAGDHQEGRLVSFAYANQ